MYGKRIKDAKTANVLQSSGDSAMKIPAQNEYAILDYYLDASTKKDIHRGIDHFLDIGGGFCDIGRYSDVGCLV